MSVKNNQVKTLYSRNLYNPLENTIRKYGIHTIEDNLRLRCISDSFNKIFSSIEIILFARILYGRVINSRINHEKTIYDPAHAKSQIINMMCIIIYLKRLKHDKRSSYYKNLVKIIIFHLQKIDDFLLVVSDDTMSTRDLYFIQYCKKWRDISIKLLNNENLEKIKTYSDELMREIKVLKIEDFKITEKNLSYFKTINIELFLA
jgi:hypothetical protein